MFLASATLSSSMQSRKERLFLCYLLNQCIDWENISAGWWRDNWPKPLIWKVLGRQQKEVHPLSRIPCNCAAFPRPPRNHASAKPLKQSPGSLIPVTQLVGVAPLCAGDALSFCSMSLHFSLHNLCGFPAPSSALHIGGGWKSIYTLCVFVCVHALYRHMQIVKGSSQNYEVRQL